jgi:uncharacterized protein
VLINVSVLLGEPLGSARNLQVEGARAHVPGGPAEDTPGGTPEGAGEGYNAAIEGTLELVRTPTGILVRARLSVSPAIECGRCLVTFIEPVALDFDEDYVLERDPNTGETVDGLSADDLRIDERQHLDLSEAVRQYEQSARPLRPVCRADCAGLCSTCGQNLNEGSCQCPDVEADDRWSGLAELAQQLKPATKDGQLKTEGSSGSS